MNKRAYIDIEGELIKVLIPSKKDEVILLSKDKILEFLKQNKIKRIVNCSFYPELISIRIPLPLSGKQLKNKKIIQGFVKSEIGKKYPNIRDFSYYYEIIQQDQRAWIRVYLIGQEYLEIINNLIINDIEVIGNYPLFLIVRELLLHVQKVDNTCQIVCLLSGKIRYIFIFRGKEMIFQRVYETEQESLGSDDVININMTITYSIQNLRINPEKVIFISKKQDISGISIPVEFLTLEDETIFNYEDLVLNLLKKFENKLRDKKILYEDYKKFIQTKNYLKYAFYLISLLCIIFLLYTSSLLAKMLEKSKEINLYKKEISYKKEIFLNLKREIEEFEKTSKPLIELYSQKASFPDMRIPINSIAKASKLTQLEINSIEIENKTPQRIKITGKVIASSFSEKQLIYSNFKESMQNEGFRLSQDRWDFTKGEFTLEAEYEPKRVF